MKEYNTKLLMKIASYMATNGVVDISYNEIKEIVDEIEDKYHNSTNYDNSPQKAQEGDTQEEPNSSLTRGVIIRVMSILLLSIISAMASYAIFRIMDSSKRELQRRANYISVIIGLIANIVNALAHYIFIYVLEMSTE